MRSYLALLFLCVQVALVLSDEEEMRKKYEKAITDCHDKWGITKQDIEDAKTKDVDMNLEKNKCSVTCILKVLHIVEKDGTINKEVGSMVLAKVAERYNITDTQSGKDAMDQCAEKIKGMKEIGCEVGACVGNIMKKEMHKYYPH